MNLFGLLQKVPTVAAAELRQELDLYLRLSRRGDLAPVRAPLEKAIAEEKTHLAGLGALLGALPA